MSQILHIFKKDTRHLWPEILASLVVTGIFVKIYPYTWATGYQVSRMPNVLAQVVVVLVPVSWWVMLTRLVHQEALVGDQQFWITRPYKWQKLLAAKLLFLAAFLYVPFFIAQSLLLHAAGFHPLSYIPGLLFSLFLITLILVIPIAAVAAVTSSFAKAVLWLLAVVVYIAGLAAVGGILFPSDEPTNYGGVTFFFVLCSLCVAAIIVQYANRNVRLSRWFIVTAAATLAVSVFPWPGSALTNIEYPLFSAGKPRPVNLEFSSNPSLHVTPYGSDEKELLLQFPLTVSDVTVGTVVRANAVKVAITAPNGLQWSSYWQFDGQYFTPADTNSTVGVKVNRAFLEKVKNLPVQVQITWAVSRLRAGATRKITLQNEAFAIPDGGICSMQNDDYSSSATCKFAMRQPRLTNFTAMWSHKPCSQGQSAGNTFVPASGWMGSLDKAPADFGITSVWTSSLYFPGQGFAASGTPADRTFLCPGAPISFTEYSLIDQARIDLVIPAIQLPYKAEPFIINFNSNN